MRNKTLLNKLKRAYFKIPNKIHNNDLSAIAIALYSYLALVPEEFNPSLSVMAKALKVSRGTALKYLKELKDRNIIECIHRGSGGMPGVKREDKFSKYKFIPPEKWK